MLLPTVLVPLAAMLQHSLGEGNSAILSDISPEKVKEIVDKLNSIRKEVQPTASNMLKMKWSKRASKNAGKWAKQCIFRNSPLEERSNIDFSCGESITQTMTANSWSDIIASWTNTKAYFKYGTGPTNPKKNVYIYTQMIYYRSNEVGCALAYCPGNTFPFLYVCHFCPGGNHQETITTPYREGPPCADCPNHCEDKLCTNPCKYTNRHHGCEGMKKAFKCDKDTIYDLCQATCRCPTEII